MSGGDRGPEEIPISDVARLDEVLAQRGPPARIAYRQGPETVREAFDHVDTTRGGEIAELHYPDGRYVTVDVPTQLEAVEVSR